MVHSPTSMSPKELQPHEVPLPRSAVIYRAGVRIGMGLLRREVEHPYGSFDRAVELMKEGYGLLVIAPHFSRRDPPEATVEGVFPILDKVGNRRILFPAAKHQVTEKIKKWSGRLQIEYSEIVTQETINRGEHIVLAEDGGVKELELHHGTEEYFDKAVEVLDQAGVVILYPQVSRMSSLIPGEEGVRPTGSLVSKLRWGITEENGERRSVDKVAILFFGMGMKGKGNYEDSRGMNFTRKFKDVWGPVYTLEEARQKAGSIKNFEPWVYQELGLVVPKEYLPKPLKEQTIFTPEK